MKHLIQVEIVQDDISHRLPIADFKARLVTEIGSVTWTVTKSQFEKKVAVAVDAVIQRIRDARA